MADWDVIAKQRLTEDWVHDALRLPSAQPGDATHRGLPRDAAEGSFDEVLVVVRERLEGTLKNLGALVNRRSPWVRPRRSATFACSEPVCGEPRATIRSRCCASCSRSASC